MAKTTDVTATFPAAITAFGTVSSWNLTQTGKNVIGHDEDGEVDAESYTEINYELEIEGETDGAAQEVADVIAFYGLNYVVDEVSYGESNDAVGTFSIKAHSYKNLG